MCAVKMEVASPFFPAISRTIGAIQYPNSCVRPSLPTNWAGTAKPGSRSSVTYLAGKGDGAVGISREAAAIAGAVVRSPATPVDRLEFNRLSGKSRLINPEVSCVPMVPGWRLPGGGIGNGPEYAVPHAIIVDRAGRRFCNDSYWVDLVPRASTPLTRICRSSSSSTSSTTASADWVTRHPAATTPTGWSPPPPRCASWRRARHRRRAAGGHGGKLQRAPHEARIPGSGGGTVEFINRFSGDPNHPFQPRARPA